MSNSLRNAEFYTWINIYLLNKIVQVKKRTIWEQVLPFISQIKLFVKLLPGKSASS